MAFLDAVHDEQRVQSVEEIICVSLKLDFIWFLELSLQHSEYVYFKNYILVCSKCQI